jgi:hypothetical protein
MPTQRLTLKMEFPPAAPTSVTAWRYRLSERTGRAEAGTAVVCVEARYATVRWTGVDRLMRLHLSGEAWRQVEVEGPRAAVLVEMIQGERRSAIDVGPAEVLTLEATPAALTAALDRLSINRRIVIPGEL